MYQGTAKILQVFELQKAPKTWFIVEDYSTRTVEGILYQALQKYTR